MAAAVTGSLRASFRGGVDQPFPGEILSSAELSLELPEYEGLVAVYALFSGGHDSLCSTFIASRHPLFQGVVHLNTGIERLSKFT